jgi:hypothetical protein
VPLSFIYFHSIYIHCFPLVSITIVRNIGCSYKPVQAIQNDPDANLPLPNAGILHVTVAFSSVFLPSSSRVSWVAGMSRIQMKLFLFSRHCTAHLQQSSNERRACNAMVYRTWPDTTATVMVRPLPRTLIENILCNPSTVGVMCDYWYDERHLLRTGSIYRPTFILQSSGPLLHGSWIDQVHAAHQPRDSP